MKLFIYSILFLITALRHSEAFYWQPQYHHQITRSPYLVTAQVDTQTGLVYFGGDSKRVVKWMPKNNSATESNLLTEEIRSIYLDVPKRKGYICEKQKALAVFELNDRPTILIEEKVIDGSFGDEIKACAFDFSGERLFAGNRGNVYKIRFDGKIDSVITTPSTLADWSDAAVDASNSNVYFIDTARNIYLVSPTYSVITASGLLELNNRFLIVVHNNILWVASNNDATIDLISLVARGESIDDQKVRSITIDGNDFTSFIFDPVAEQAYITYMTSNRPQLTRMRYIDGNINRTIQFLSTKNVNVRAVAIDNIKGFLFYAEYDSSYNMVGVSISNCGEYSSNCTECIERSTPDYCGWCFSSSSCAIKSTCETSRNCSLSPISAPDNTQNDNRDTGSSGVSLVILIGSILGSLVVLCGLSALVYIFIIRRNKNKKDNDSSSRNFKGNSMVYNLSTRSSTTSSTPIMIRDVAIKERLGGGHFSDVFRGEWQGTTQVALKKLKSGQDMEQFMLEATMLQSLNHPQIVRFLGIYESNEEGGGGDRYIVCEYMENGSLNNYLMTHESTVDMIDLLNMAKQISAGMKYLEDNHVIHRDLALRNILLTFSGKGKYVVKVGDLGMSRNLETDYYTSNQRNVPVKWSAPEVIQYGKTTSKSDVWSYGIMLWELFSFGKLPYMGMSNQEVISLVISEGYRMEAPKGCMPEVYELMKTCWSPNPMDRPTFHQIFTKLDELCKSTCKSLGINDSSFIGINSNMSNGNHYNDMNDTVYN